MSNFTNRNSSQSGPNLATCPDCAAVADGDGVLEHAAICPVGTGVGAACGSDRLWFALHPGERERIRPVTWAELADVRIAAPGATATHVVVTRLGDGLRARQFCTIVALPEAGAA